MKLTLDKPADDQVILHIDGRLDAETAPAFKQTVKDLAADGVKFIAVDMSQLTFVDSSGLSAFVSALKTLRQLGGALNLAAVGPQAKTALRLTMLDKVLPIFETIEQAAARSE